jgi:hypothetical protein
MSFSFAVERRHNEWHAYVREVPGTGSLGPTQEAAIAGAARKLAEKFERHELPELDIMFDLVTAEAPPPGMKSFTGADFLALWKTLPHPDPGWADDVEAAVRSQPLTSGESPWDR